MYRTIATYENNNDSGRQCEKYYDHPVYIILRHENFKASRTYVLRTYISI